MSYFLLILLFISGQAHANVTYTMADLEVLVSEDNYSEFFDHALDIRPSERSDAWAAMVVKMGDLFSKVVSEKPTIAENDFSSIEQLIGWPPLRKDDVFRLRRQQIGLRFLGQCLKKNDSCVEQIKAFWEKDKNDAETAFKLAELTQGIEHFPISTWSFLEVSLKSPLSEFFCKKEFVMQTLWGKIEIDYVKLGPDGDLMKRIDQTVHPDCIPILVSEANKRLISPPKLLDRELSFQILKSQMKATSEISDFFHTVYLLDNPSQGELFNYSWNRLKELGGNSSRREAVLKQLKALDPLPDSVLSSFDITKKKVIMKHFKTYFPEYLDHYTGKCLSFYGGKGVFPSGNPTIHCQELMKSELGPHIIDDHQIKEFLNLRKI